MARQRRCATSKMTSASGLLTTICALSVIVNAKKSHQPEIHRRHRFNVERRSDITLNKTDNNTLTDVTGATTEIAGSEYSSDLRRVAIDDNADSTLKISERSSLFDLALGAFKTAVSLVTEPYINENQGKHTCYRDVCFTPEDGLGLKVGGPVKPEEENTTFVFFDSSRPSGIEVNESTWETFFATYQGDISKPLVAVVHGLNGSRHIPWALTLIQAFLENVDCNVLQVDWQERARFPYYAKAASSAPLVGVILSHMLHKIIKTSNYSLHPDNVHVVGFSLGAHVAGVCGRHFYNATGDRLGRITGLDPAGPLFQHSNVCLSANDAQFVDVVHTNAGELEDGRLGINKSIGHVDFYPNGGSDQPNCPITTDPACSHERVQALFTESVYNNCSFKSYYCQGGWKAFERGECRTKNSSYIGEMGYHSFSASGRRNQYLYTTGNPPYCSNKTKLGIDFRRMLASVKKTKKKTTTPARYYEGAI